MLVGLLLNSRVAQRFSGRAVSDSSELFSMLKFDDFIIVTSIVLKKPKFESPTKNCTAQR